MTNGSSIVDSYSNEDISNIELTVMSTGELSPQFVWEFANLKNHNEEGFVVVPDDMGWHDEENLHDYYLWSIVTAKLSDEQKEQFRQKAPFRWLNDELNFYSHVYFIVSDVDDKKMPIVLRYVKSTDDRFIDLRFTIVTSPDVKRKVLSTFLENAVANILLTAGDGEVETSTERSVIEHRLRIIEYSLRTARLIEKIISTEDAFLQQLFIESFLNVKMGRSSANS